jgi:hypothetical protein
MRARRRPPKEPGPTEPKNGDHWADVVLEKLHEHTVLLEKLHGQTIVLEQGQGHLRVVSERALDTLTKRESLEIAARTEGQIAMLMDAFRVTRGELGETRKELGARIDGVDKRFDDVDKRFDDFERELRGVRQDVARQAQGSELKALEQRMTVVERHLGL